MALREGGDPLEAWLDSWYPRAYRAAYGLLGDRGDAEDAVQEAFLRMWRFRASAPDDEGFAPWLYRVVVNASLSKRRGDRRYRDTVVGPPPAGEDAPAGPGADPEQRALVSDTAGVVLDALLRLPEDLRVVIVLRYYGQLSEREIARVIRRRPGTVKSRLHAARSRLGDDPALIRLADGDDGADGDGRADADADDRDERRGGLPSGAGGR